MKTVVLIFLVAVSGGFLSLGSNDELARSIARGKLIYAENCITCHLGKGEGVKGVYPPLAGADYLMKDSTNKVISVLKYGLEGPVVVNGVTYNGVMPGPGLEAEEIADVINYIKNSWGNTSAGKVVTKKMVEHVK